MLQTLAQSSVETAQAWEKQATTTGEVREIIGAVDETFFEQMMLVCMDLKTGYLLLEEVAADRTYTTWKALVDERLKALGAHVLYVVSDRAKALIQLAAQGLKCLIHAAATFAAFLLPCTLRQRVRSLDQSRPLYRNDARSPVVCISMPAFFHLVHEIVKGYSLALGRRVRQAHKALAEAQRALTHIKAPHEAPAARRW